MAGGLVFDAQRLEGACRCGMLAFLNGGGLRPESQPKGFRCGASFESRLAADQTGEAFRQFPGKREEPEKSSKRPQTP